MVQAVKKDLGTRDRLVSAAEKLFAEKGFYDVSLRDITNTAEANVASVNYYFRSKEALADEVITLHITPVNEARVKELQILVEHHAPDPVPVRDLLNAFMKPMIERMHSSSLRNDLFGKIMGRCMGDKGQALPSQIELQMRDVLGFYIKELTRSLPQLTPDLVLYRLHFSFGAVAHTLLFSERLSNYSQVKVEVMNAEKTLNRVVDYCMGGLLAESNE